MQLAEHLSSDSCTLTKLEIKDCRMNTDGLRTIMCALHLNQTLERLMVRGRRLQDGSEDVSVDSSWTDLLLSALKVNSTLAHIEIPSLNVSKDFHGLLAFGCIINKYRPHIMGVSKPVVLPLALSSMLAHSIGCSVLYPFLTHGAMKFITLNGQWTSRRSAEAEEVDGMEVERRKRMIEEWKHDRNSFS